MIEFSADLDFRSEAIESKAAADFIRMWNLNGNATACFGVCRAENGCHAAGRHKALEPIVIEQVSGTE